MTDSPDLHLLIGRVEGKVDTLVSLHTHLNSRIETIEARQTTTETRLSTIEGRGAGARTWIGWAIALIVGAASVVLHFVKGGPA